MLRPTQAQRASRRAATERWMAPQFGLGISREDARKTGKPTILAVPPIRTGADGWGTHDADLCDRPVEMNWLMIGDVSISPIAGLHHRPVALPFPCSEQHFRPRFRPCDWNHTRLCELGLTPVRTGAYPWSWNWNSFSRSFSRSY